jgi:hypothetical protein
MCKSSTFPLDGQKEPPAFCNDIYDLSKLYASEMYRLDSTTNTEMKMLETTQFVEYLKSASEIFVKPTNMNLLHPRKENDIQDFILQHLEWFHVISFDFIEEIEWIARNKRNEWNEWDELFAAVCETRELSEFYYQEYRDNVFKK